MIKNIKQKFLFFSLMLLPYASYARENTVKLESKLGGAGALSAYLQELAKNLNDVVRIGFLLVCGTSAISILFSNDNVVKALAKIAFGLFLLKGCASVLASLL